jgi:hypothetical protein
MEKGKLLVTAIECCRIEAQKVLNGGAEVCHSDCDAVDDAQILGDDQLDVPKQDPHLLWRRRGWGLRPSQELVPGTISRFSQALVPGTQI